MSQTTLFISKTVSISMQNYCLRPESNHLLIWGWTFLFILKFVISSIADFQLASYAHSANPPALWFENVDSHSPL